ncbi:MAG: alpha/beta hydrolase-fold protein [Verrucomicrobiota bacterium]|jgi:enterochelin esterase-like enzyme
MKLAHIARGAALLFLLAGPSSVFGAAEPASPTAPAAANTPPTGRGAGQRGGNRGAPITPEEQAEVAKLADLPALTPGAGDGDYSIGPMFAPAPEQTPRADVPKGKVVQFTMDSAESKFYSGISKTNPGVVVPYKRAVTVYIPSQYVPGAPAPFILTHDAQGAKNNQLPAILDNMIADHRLPVMIAIMVMSGGGDGPGSERGLEYDTVSGKYAEFIEAEVLPRVERDYHLTLTRDPEGRATLGGSSGGAVAFTMAWFHPELYHRVITYSGTYTSNQSPTNAASPHGAWEYHEHFIPESPRKPLRVWMEVGQNDNGATTSASGFHNWVIANQRMAAVLKAKGYHYQFVYAKGAGHVDGRAVAQTLPEALLWVWKGYPITQ